MNIIIEKNIILEFSAHNPYLSENIEIIPLKNSNISFKERYRRI